MGFCRMCEFYTMFWLHILLKQLSCKWKSGITVSWSCFGMHNTNWWRFQHFVLYPSLYFPSNKVSLSQLLETVLQFYLILCSEWLIFVISLNYLKWMPFPPLGAMHVTRIRVLCFLSPSFSHFLTILSILCFILCEINCNDAGEIIQLSIKLQYSWCYLNY